MRKWLLIGLVGVMGLQEATPTNGPSTRPAEVFTNPIVRSVSAGDPTVVLDGGHYYFTATLPKQDGWYIWKAKNLTEIDRGEKVKIWSAPKKGPASHELWAPELYRFGDRWYLYFTATDGKGLHRHYVLESVSSDPMGGWEFKGDVDPEHPGYSIDGSVLQVGGKKYWMYAGDHGERGLNIVPMESPLRVQPGAGRLRFAVAAEPWEAAWWRDKGKWVKGDFGWIEAPQELHHGDRTFVVYSAGHTGTPHYAMGMLELVGADPMQPASWRKGREPVFRPTGPVFTVGHCAFTKSPDGAEDWILYHARDAEWDAKVARTVRAQRFEFHVSGVPAFGEPVPAGVELKRPSGEK